MKKFYTILMTFELCMLICLASFTAGFCSGIRFNLNKEDLTEMTEPTEEIVWYVEINNE